MEREGPLAFLGQACREMRKEHGVRLIEIAWHLRRGEASLSRFESGKVLPHDTDHVAYGYSEVLNVLPTEIWDRCFELWREAGI